MCVHVCFHTITVESLFGLVWFGLLDFVEFLTRVGT